MWDRKTHCVLYIEGQEHGPMMMMLMESLSNILMPDDFTCIYFSASMKKVSRIYVTLKKVLRSKYMARIRHIWSYCPTSNIKVAATNMLIIPIIS